MAGAALRVVFCTRGGVHGALALDRLLASPRIVLAGLVLSTRMLRTDQGYAAGALECVRRSGPAYAGYLWCSTALADAALSFTAPGRVRARAARAGAPVHATQRIDEDASRAFIERCAPDLLVSAFFNQRIGERVAAIPRLGAVNIHPSALPRFRGVDPVFHACLQGSSTLGATVHRLSPEFDKGPILRQEASPVRAGESVLAATARLYARGAELLVDALEDLEAGAAGSAQDAGGSEDSWPTRAQVAALGRRGIALARAGELAHLSRIVKSARPPPR